MRTQNEIFADSNQDNTLVVESLLDIRELLKPLEPSKPSKGYETPDLTDTPSEEIFVMKMKDEDAIRADERTQIYLLADNLQKYVRNDLTGKHYTVDLKDLLDLLK